MHGLAGAVDATLGEHIGVESSRWLASGDAAIGEIEGRLCEIEKGIVAARPRGDEQRRREPAFAARQAGRKRHRATSVSGLGGQHLVVAGDQPELDACKRRGCRERVDEGVDAVGPRIGREAVIRHDEPLGGPLAVFIAGHAGRLGGEDVDARRHLRHRLGDREGGGDLGVELFFDLELAGPNLFALLVGDVVEAVLVEIALEIVAEHVVDQAAVADPVDGHVDRVRIHRNERDALLTGTRKHIGFAREPHRWGPVAHIEGELGILEQGLVHCRGQALAQRDGIGLAVFQPFHAKLLIVGGERWLVVADNRHEGREVGAFQQRLGKLEAGAWACRVGVHGEIGDAKAVFLAQLVVGRLPARIGFELERQVEGVQCRAPIALLAVRRGERRQGGGFGLRRGRSLIGDIGGGPRIAEADAAVVLLIRRDGEPQIGQPPPSEGVVGRHGDDLPIGKGGAFQVLPPQLNGRLLFQLEDRQFDGAGLILEVGLERDRRVGEGVVLKDFIGGLGWGGDENEQRGNEACAEPRDHRCPPRRPAFGSRRAMAPNLSEACDGNQRHRLRCRRNQEKSGKRPLRACGDHL